MKTNAVDRYRDIERYIIEQNDVKVADLTKRFFLSEATVRRVLTSMENQGMIRRYHGGARLVDPASLSKVQKRKVDHAQEKEAIGKLAASFVLDGMTLLMTGGSSVAAMCPFLKQQGLTVITNSLPVINALNWEKNVQVIVLGGVLNATEMESRGPITEHSLDRLRADILFLGTSGVHPVHGIMTDDPNAIGTYARCLNVSDDMYVLADHSKFVNSTGTTMLYRLNETKNIITDDQLPQQYEDILSKLNIRLHIARAAADPWGIPV